MILFDEALERACQGILSCSACRGELERMMLVRDINGRLSLLVHASREVYHQEIEAIGLTLGPYCAEPSFVLYKDDLYDMSIYFRQLSGVMPVLHDGRPTGLRFLDRLLVGEDWMAMPEEIPQNRPPRIVFYGFKGGVGRSTALAAVAAHLARNGKHVLVFDFDLESPGLSELLLTPEEKTPYGIVDWMAEDLVGQSDAILPDMLAHSLLSADMQGDITVVSAIGGKSSGASYISKLSRAYVDKVDAFRVDKFPHRMETLIRRCEDKIHPDVVLIDSRAGLHEIAAASLTCISAYVLLFATGSSQTWDGIGTVFAHWGKMPDLAVAMRERLKMVYAMFPETEQDRRRTDFMERSHRMFTDLLYDELSPDDPEPFSGVNYQMDDQEAPHYPVTVNWSNRMVEMDRNGLFTQSDANALNDYVYGQLFRYVDTIVDAARRAYEETSGG